jgi:aminoglycoside phosphotransferase family enzyme
MSVVLNFTLDPLRSWLSYRSKDNKASESEYLEQTLANETSSPLEVGLATRPNVRARVDVVSTSDASQRATTTPVPEQVALAARSRQDVLVSIAATSDQDDGEEV